MISVKNLTKQYGPLTAVDEVSFEVPAGSIFGLVGPNGAGKTTAMRIMATLLSRTSGEIQIAGRSIFKYPRQTRQVIGYMPDFFGVYDDLRVSEYLEFYGEASGCYIGEVRRAIPALLELVGLADKAGDLVNNLSRGMKQRLCLARTLVHQPQVLILDEPASGLDPRARVELRNILQELQQMGQTIVISSHILADLAQLCTHIAIMNSGRLPLCGPIAEVLARVQGDNLIEISILERADQARLWLLEQQEVRSVTYNNKGSLEVVFAGDQGARARLLAEMARQYQVAGFIPTSNNLEDIFMLITEEAGDEVKPAVG